MRPPSDSVWIWKDLHLFTTMVRPLFCRFHCEGREHVPSRGGCILTCNHVMGPDFIVIGYASPRQVKFMAKQELFERSRMLTWLFETCGTFPIRRGDTDLAAVEHAINLVKAGDVLGMFPEGTRSRTGKLQRGRSGVARIAILAQAPVVPAVVINAEPIFKPENWFSLKPRAAVTVRFGPPLAPPNDPNDSRGLRAYTRQIMDAMNNLLPEDRRAELARRATKTEAEAAADGAANEEVAA